MTITALIIGEMFFVMISVLEIGNFNALKNALILSLARPVRSLAILLIVFALVFGVMSLMPISIVLLIFIWVVIAQYPISCLVYDLIEEMILIPFQNRVEKG